MKIMKEHELKTDPSHKPGWDDYLFAFATLPLYIVAALVGFVTCAIVDGFLKGWRDYKGVCDRPLGDA
jgi:hypothetical protein